MEKQVAIITLSLLILFSCKKENKSSCIKSHGQEITETIEIDSYSVIDISGHVNIEINPNQKSIAELTGGKNILPLIQCEVINDTLYINNNNTCNWARSYDREINITLYCDSLEGIVNRSTGKLLSTDTIRNKNTFTLKGKAMNGETNLTLSANRMDFNYLDGTSTVYLSGKVNIASFYCKSLGYIEASNLFSGETIVNHYGTGELNVYSSIYLRGWINHTGNVYYNGSPKTIDVDEFNSGELIEK